MEQLRITDTPAGPISYLLTRKRVKNLNLRVRNGQVSLSMPLGCPAEEADAMVRAKCRWIIQALERQWAPGPELPPEVIERLFTRFYRAPQTKDKPGFGLGLSIAENIVRRCRGRIWAASGGGMNSFHAELPKIE